MPTGSQFFHHLCSWWESLNVVRFTGILQLEAWTLLWPIQYLDPIFSWLINNTNQYCDHTSMGNTTCRFEQ